MAAPEFSAYKDILVVLGAAGIVIPVFRRIGIGAIPGFLLTGLLIGPSALGSLVAEHDWLKYLTISSPERIASLAELGVVFLLFLIGLELSFSRLVSLRRLVFGLGGLQVLVSASAIGLIALAFGLPPVAAAVLGLALSLSSTAVVIQLLSDQKRIGTTVGRASFSVLLMQDLAVIPILIFTTLMARDTAFSPAVIGEVLVKAVIGVGAIFAAGRFLMRPLLRLAAHARSADLFMAVTLLIAVGTGAVASLAGLSMALGAFMAGLMLAETEYRREIEAIIEPFKGLLLGMYFLLIGMGLGIAHMLSDPLLVLGIAVGLVALKALILFVLARAFRIASAPALETALMLGAGGEFAFVVLGGDAMRDLAGTEVAAPALTAVALTMTAIPLLSHLGRGMFKKALGQEGLTPDLAGPPPDDAQPTVIIAGFGRVGRMIAQLLDEHRIAYIAIEQSPALLAEGRRAGLPVYYGDATRPDLLRRCGIAHAKAVAITIGAAKATGEIAQAVRKENAAISVVARARDDRHAMALYELGVSEAVPEAFESSLQLGEAVMVEAGVPMGLAIASVHERRDQHRLKLGRPDRRAELKRLRNRVKLER